MAKLIYMMNMSLDGYIEDEHGNFAFAAPLDEEVKAWIFPHVSSFRTYLYGRRMYETVVYWETAHTLPLQTKLGNALRGSGRQRRKSSTPKPSPNRAAEIQKSSAVRSRRRSPAEGKCRA